MSNELPPINDEYITSLPNENDFDKKDSDDVYVVDSVNELDGKKEKPKFKKKFYSVPEEIKKIIREMSLSKKEPQNLEDEIEAIDSFINEINDGGLSNDYQLVTLAVSDRTEFYSYGEYGEDKIVMPPNKIYFLQRGNLVEAGSVLARGHNMFFYGEQLVRIGKNLVLLNSEFGIGMQVVDYLGVKQYRNFPIYASSSERVDQCKVDYEDFEKKLIPQLKTTRPGVIRKLGREVWANLSSIY